MGSGPILAGAQHHSAVRGRPLSTDISRRDLPSSVFADISDHNIHGEASDGGSERTVPTTTGPRTTNHTGAKPGRHAGLDGSAAASFRPPGRCLYGDVQKSAL